MSDTVLIANRGEIACRIIRTAGRRGLRTVAIFSEADRDALHTGMADEAHCVGPSPAAQSYLNAGRILDIAANAGVTYIHPGYGFLAENADFAECCEKRGLKFVGPSAAAMRLMGRKDEAKALMADAGVPVVPGISGEDVSGAALKQKIAELGLPVMIKAVAGGGGKGMRRVDREDDLDEAVASARREAQAAFGDPDILVEKLIERPRHIEVQIFADGHGNVVHLFERDCSLQRRHQKVIEEAPAPDMPRALREAMCAAAVKAAGAVGYEGAGTVEFLLPGGPLAPDTPYYFMEMNTRLQVEHPVTEAVTGLDLVDWQFRVARGEKLPLAQDEIHLDGHAVEARIYAEDPGRDFLPSTGRLYALRFPHGDGLRVDTGVQQGDVVTPYYDPMIAKLIAHGRTRAEAIGRLQQGLEQTVLAGPNANIAFLHALLSHRDVVAGTIDTGLIEHHIDALTGQRDGPAEKALLDGVMALMYRRRTADNPLPGHDDPWDSDDGFQLGGTRRVTCDFLVDNRPVTISFNWEMNEIAAELVQPPGENGLETAAQKSKSAQTEIVETGDGVLVLHDMHQIEMRWPDFASRAESDAGGDGIVVAPLHGRIIEVSVAEGSDVAKGDRLAVLEAMKMEHVLNAPLSGRIESLAVSEGEQVEQGARLFVIVET